MSGGGRPRHELTTKRKRELERLSQRAATAAEKATALQTELARVANEALEEGASLRAVGETIGLPRTSVWRFIQQYVATAK